MAEANLLLALVPPSGVADLFLQRILGQLRLQDLLVRLRLLRPAHPQATACSVQLTGRTSAGPPADVQAAAGSHPGLCASAHLEGCR